MLTSSIFSKISPDLTYPMQELPATTSITSTVPYGKQTNDQTLNDVLLSDDGSIHFLLQQLDRFKRCHHFSFKSILVFQLERIDHFPLFLHVNHCPVMVTGIVQTFVEFAYR